jgi:hypothetical protein
MQAIANLSCPKVTKGKKRMGDKSRISDTGAVCPKTVAFLAPSVAINRGYPQLTGSQRHLTALNGTCFMLLALRCSTTCKKGKLRSGKFRERHELSAKGDS